mgnify:CR=1 FL=1
MIVIVEALSRIECVNKRAAQTLADALAPVADRLPERLIADLADVVVWSFAQERSFGQTFVAGLAILLRRTDIAAIEMYLQQVRQAGTQGPALGALMAEHLSPVLAQGDPDLTDRFIKTVWELYQVGHHALTKPLPAVVTLLEEGDAATAAAYLDTLRRAFRRCLSYQQTLRFCRSVPRAVLDFDPRKRLWQTLALGQVAQTEFQMIDAFLEGLAAGLGLLSQGTLGRFVDVALSRWQRQRRSGIEFLALRSRAAIEWLAAHQTTATLAQVRPALLRYLQARTGRALNIYALQRLPAGVGGAENAAETVCCDGTNLYLPDQISSADTLAGNVALYWQLARLECGVIEFDSFGFDLKKLNRRYLVTMATTPEPMVAAGRSDLQQFLGRFPNFGLAADLFTIYEHGRLRRLTALRYPGLGRRLDRHIKTVIEQQPGGRAADDFRSRLYRSIALGAGGCPSSPTLTRLCRIFEAHMIEMPAAETSGVLVARTYGIVAAELIVQGVDLEHLAPMATPYNRRIDANLHAAVHHDALELARKVTDLLGRAGFDCLGSHVRRTLAQRGAEGLIDGLGAAGGNDPDDMQAAMPLDPATVEALRQLLIEQGHRIECRSEEIPANALWYPEWDRDLNGYLHCHAAVHERLLKGSDAAFHERVRQRHGALIRATRYAFEMMRPEALAILRQWREGDDFDHRALVDFAVERQARRNPSERVYIKRLKNERSVAVLLLVDLSRSTANLAVDGLQAVIEIEKEAIYIFCRALGILGDDFGVAGFSGNGRLQVNYSVLKAFEEPFDQAVIARVGSAAPQRNTRMGAAIRHATAQLCARPAKVPLLIILGDGFPNDVDYKQVYALADTRKALAEARARGVFTHGITVNMAADPRMDDLYGDTLHTVISDVRELPNKLVRIYSALTRR